MPKIRGIKPDFWTDETMVELPPLARLLFIGLWNYACDNGHLEDKPRQIKMRVLPADDCDPEELLQLLTDTGRIERKKGSITVLKFSTHQRIDRRFFTTCDRPDCHRPDDAPPRPRRKPVEDTTSTRGEHGEEMGRPPGEGDGDSDGDGDGDGDSSGGLTPAATTGTSLALVGEERPDVERLCDHLANRIEENGSKRPTIGKTWRDAARLMLDRDHRAEVDVMRAIDWCQADSFWRSNVLSMPTLRDKYETLRLQAQRPKGTGKQQETDDMFARAMARAEAREAQMRGDSA